MDLFGDGEATLEKAIYGMLSGEIHTSLSPEHPIIST